MLWKGQGSSLFAGTQSPAGPRTEGEHRGWPEAACSFPKARLVLTRGTWALRADWGLFKRGQESRCDGPTALTAKASRTIAQVFRGTQIVSRAQTWPQTPVGSLRPVALDLSLAEQALPPPFSGRYPKCLRSSSSQGLSLPLASSPRTPTAKRQVWCDESPLSPP